MRYIAGVDGKSPNAYLRDDLMRMMQDATLYACVALVLIVVIYWLMHAKEVTPEMTLDMALFFAIFLPFVMPKIHERYFFMADMLSILYAARRGDRRFVPLLVIGASLMSYMPILTRQRPVDERILGLMMLGALIAVSRDLLSAMRQNRRPPCARPGAAAGGGSGGADGCFEREQGAAEQPQRYRRLDEPHGVHRAGGGGACGGAGDAGAFEPEGIRASGAETGADDARLSAADAPHQSENAALYGTGSAACAENGRDGAGRRE